MDIRYPKKIQVIDDCQGQKEGCLIAVQQGIHVSPDNVGHFPQTDRINLVHRLIANVTIEIAIKTGEADRIFGRPAPDGGIVVARAEAYECGVGVVDASSEAKGLKTRGGILGHVAEAVVVHSLDDTTRGRIDHEANTANLIGDDAESNATPHHVERIMIRAIDKATDHGAGTIQFRSDA